MAVVLCFVDKNVTIKERFIGVVYVRETSSLTLNLAIDGLKNVRGQGYDGASNMKGDMSLILRETFELLANDKIYLEKYRKVTEKGISNGEIFTGKGKNQECSLARPEILVGVLILRH
uniref:DUF4371 domain-containing protein n=1 Tax=Brassica oleracea var. oleracea TaxID=109376 RepID=A0A0D3B852_BRAOL